MDQERSNPGLLNPLNLAFVGDAVYEVMVRERLVSGGSVPIGRLHKRSVEIVCAAAQAQAYDYLERNITPEELSILHRGKNANIGRVAKNSTILEYRKATAVEALFGYLYLKGEKDRLRVIFDEIVQILIK